MLIASCLPRPVTSGAQVGLRPLDKLFRPPLEICVGHSLKLLDIVQKFCAPLRKLFAPPGVLSWLWACVYPTLIIKSFSCHGKSK